MAIFAALMLQYFIAKVTFEVPPLKAGQAKVASSLIPNSSL